MKMSVGVDSIEIARIARCLEREHFVGRVYSAAERRMLAKRGMPAQTAAGYFAAKEAFAKALGTGVRGFALSEVSVEYSPLGQPVLVLSGRAKRLAGWRSFALSITHTKTTATAIVVSYR